MARVVMPNRLANPAASRYAGILSILFISKLFSYSGITRMASKFNPAGGRRGRSPAARFFFFAQKFFRRRPPLEADFEFLSAARWTALSAPRD
jgi:hypothetical protein